MTDIAAALEADGILSSDNADEDVSDTTRMLPASEREEESGELGHSSVSINNEEDDPNAVAREAQALAQMQHQLNHPMSFLGFLRRGNFFIILYFIPVTVILISVLIVDWETKCNKPLKAWACTQVGIQLIMIFVHIMFLKTLENPLEDERPRPASPLLIVNKILNLLWFTWFIVGMVWTFQAGDSCSSTSPYLYRMCFSLIIIQIVILSLAVLFCCCSCVVLLTRVMINQRATAPRGATNNLIRSLQTKRYTEGLLKEDDKQCAICLADYSEDEVLRFLPCGHHFHRICVDKWLIANKSCPFCKRNIDEPPPESVYSSSPAALDIINNDDSSTLDGEDDDTTSKGDGNRASSGSVGDNGDSGSNNVNSNNNNNDNNMEQNSIIMSPISPPPEFISTEPPSSSSSSSSTNFSSNPLSSVSSSNTDEIV